jgi:2,3-dihydroxy-2,3-dihydro-p-cumate dehydrogenase
VPPGPRPSRPSSPAHRAALEKVLAVIPAGRPGTVEEVASMAAYLASEESGFITGQVLSVNGCSTML